MNPADLLRAVRSIALETPLVALDVVEVSPPYDLSENTVNNAHRVVLETLGALASKKREQAGGEATRPGAKPDPATLRYPVQPETWSRPAGPGDANTYTEHDHHLQGDREDHA
jgi:Arginase family